MKSVHDVEFILVADKGLAKRGNDLNLLDSFVNEVSTFHGIVYFRISSTGVVKNSRIFFGRFEEILSYSIFLEILNLKNEFFKKRNEDQLRERTMNDE